MGLCLIITQGFYATLRSVSLPRMEINTALYYPTISPLEYLKLAPLNRLLMFARGYRPLLLIIVL